MATSNRDRVGQGFELLAAGLGPWVDQQMCRTGARDRWFEAYSAQTARGQELRLSDPAVQLKVIADFWEPVFRNVLGRSDRSHVFLLRDARNKWAHNEGFSADDAYRTLDQIELLLTAASAGEQVGRVRRLKDEIMRARYAEQERRVEAARAALVATSPAAGLPAWRDVVTPHHDVATGRFSQAEFAADLGQVARGEGAPEYVERVEFFRRTFLTDGLRRMLEQAVQRVSASGGVPVVDLQTTFGGGKTHSLLALWHLFSAAPVDQLPDEVRALVGDEGADWLRETRRAALVGTDLRAGERVRKLDGTVVATMWGELAWQLGGAEGYAMVAASDEKGTSPGDALIDLFRRYSPCVVLIDEWVAYARQLFGRDDLPGRHVRHPLHLRSEADRGRASGRRRARRRQHPGVRGPPRRGASGPRGARVGPRGRRVRRPRGAAPAQGRGGADGVGLAVGVRRGVVRDRASPAVRADLPGRRAPA